MDNRKPEEPETADRVPDGTGGSGAPHQDPFVEPRANGRRSVDSDWRLRLAAYLVLLAAAFYGGFVLQQKVDHNTARIGSLARRSVLSEQAQLDGSCYRLNILRAEANRNQFADYRFDLLEVRLVEASLRQRTASVSRTKAQRAATAKFVVGLKRLAGAKEWIGLTNCVAVHSPSYKIPLPVPFSKRLPPAGALYPTQIAGCYIVRCSTG